MEDSNSTPSPMSSAASSQDSLHRNRASAANSAAMAQHQQQQQDYYAAYGQAGPNAAHMMMGAGAGGKKAKGVKSTLGRIFGKKDKQLKAMKVSGGSYVTGPMMVNSPSGGFPQQSSGPHPAYSGGAGSGLGGDLLGTPGGMGGGDLPSSDSMSVLGGLAGKGDFDRRKKKK